MSKKVTRYDLGELKTTETTPQGFLKVPVFATRTGVFKYRTGDGRVIRELRHPSEVFDSDSLASLAAAPITLEHPPEMVNPSNVKEYMKGFIIEAPTRHENKVETIAVISHEDAISAVLNGMREVSCGYHADLIDESGIYDGEEYDKVQKNIRYNHLAIVKKGRAGPEVRLKLDAADAVQESEGENQEGEKKMPMEKVMLGEREFECDSELAAAIKDMMEQKAKLEDACKEKEMDAEKVKADMDNAKAEAVKLQAKVDELDAELKKREDSAPKAEEIAQQVKARVALERVGAHVLKDSKLEEMSDIEIKKAVIKADFAQADLEGKSDEYISARFDGVAERIRESAEFKKGLGEALTKGTSKNDSSEKKHLAAEARKKMMEESLNAWKNPVGKTKETA